MKLIARLNRVSRFGISEVTPTPTISLHDIVDTQVYRSKFTSHTTS